MPSNLPPLSLYVHIPWCIRKCPYCDFNSHQSDAKIPEAEYVDALINDLDSDLAWLQQLAGQAESRQLTSIFFGGGTPSLFGAESIGKVIDHARNRLGFKDNIEITLEANPGTAEYTRFDELRSAGVNRLSMGVQSFNDDHLKTLGRIHSSANVLTAFEQARKGGFENINLDLMHGLPQQTAQQAMADLEQAISLAPEHLSWYQLTIEPNTVFFNSQPPLPQDDVLADIQDAGENTLQRNGYAQYEVSAFAPRGQRAQHNVNYWQFGDYLGIGAGAHGKVSQLIKEPASDMALWRYRKTRLPQHYLDRNPSSSRSDDSTLADSTSNNSGKPFWAGKERVPSEKQTLEFMMNALRLREGVSIATFEARTEISYEAISARVAALVSQGLMVDSPNTLRPTDLGFRFLNTVLARFDDEAAIL